MPNRFKRVLRVYYVYVLFDWLGIPRYVGKGRGSRWTDHERSTDPRNQAKNEFIERTWIVLGEIPKIKVREDLTEAAAFATETALIKAIGRLDLGTGPLTNMSDGGEGLGLTFDVRSRNTGNWWKNKTPEERQAIRRKGAATLGPEGRRKASLKAAATQTPEQRSEKIRKWHATRTTEERQETTRKRLASTTSEQRSNAVRKGAASRTPKQRVAMSKLWAKRTQEERDDIVRKRLASLDHSKLSANARRWQAELSLERRSEINKLVGDGLRKAWTEKTQEERDALVKNLIRSQGELSEAAKRWQAELSPERRLEINKRIGDGVKLRNQRKKIIQLLINHYAPPP